VIPDSVIVAVQQARETGVVDPAALARLRGIAGAERCPRADAGISRTPET